ncbi:MAG: decaprenyl-phosphate phosphoribosyltransferase [Myxococcales bacterium]|nr:decaprenyl-phosphate phosphoribosyltransferase [Myxococcales bacterium]
MSEPAAPDASSADTPPSGEIPQQPTALTVLRLLRPKQWTKNALVFAALVFAGRLLEPQAVLLALLAFSSFCAAASSVYIINDLLDVDRDRLHPEKRKRPIASGAIRAEFAFAIAAVLTAVALAIAFFIGLEFGVAVIFYMAMSHFYSLSGKTIAILDVMLIAAGFVIRAVGGALAIDVPSSNWFILCTMFLAVFIALCKRKAELLALSDGAGQTRPVLRAYTVESLNAFIATSMGGVLISYALYVLDTRYTPTMSFQVLTLTLPFVMFGVFRYYLLVETAQAGERAEEVLLRDRPIQLSVLGFALVAISAIYLGN